MQTGMITLAPGETVTVLFDVAVFAPPGGHVNFANTLLPAATFFTDSAGQKVDGILALGPSAPPSVAPTTVALSPGSGSTALGNGHTLLATVTGAGGARVIDATVTFTIISGPSAGITQQVPTDMNGEAAFTYFGMALGTDMIRATVAAVTSTDVIHTWTAGAPHHIVISPSSATISAGGQQAYTATAFDQFNHSLGDVTGATSFVIAPDGSCTSASCTATTAGGHTVTATYLALTAEASLEVTGGEGGGGFAFSGFLSPIDGPPVVNIAKAGSAIPIRFSLGGYQGMDILAPGSPASQQMACEAGAPSDTVETISAGGSGLTYDADTDRYVYVWKTEKSWAKSCRQLTLTLSDGSIHTALFKFDK
jgi:hypothetical protein